MSDAEAALDRADMARLAAGQEAALDSLMARHAGRLHAYLHRLLGNSSDAEDLAQETFVRVHEHRARFDGERSFTTWLYTIASNLARDRYRWRSRHPESPLDTPSDASGSQLRDTLPDPRRAPADQALASERAAAVQAAVAALPDDLRVPLVLSEFEERSHQEIGAILGCSPKAVEMRLYRARHLLRASLASWLDTPDKQAR